MTVNNLSKTTPESEVERMIKELEQLPRYRQREHDPMKPKRTAHPQRLRLTVQVRNR